MVVIRTVQIFDNAGALEGVAATVTDITREAEPAKRQIVAESLVMREMLSLSAESRSVKQVRYWSRARTAPAKI